MTPYKRFFLGGGGALMPVLVSLLAIDIGAILGSEANLSTGNIIGFVIRYIILFVVGGFVAYLHEDETKPFKLFELGIAAPALITSLITAQGVVGSPAQTPTEQTAFKGISIISSAYADTSSKSEPIIIAGGLFGDIFRGASGSVYRDVGKSSDAQKTTAAKAAKNIGETVEKAMQDTGKTLEKSVQDTEISNEDIKIENEQKNILIAKSEAARTRAIAARAKADALEAELQASLAQANAAEAEALAAEQEARLLESNHIK